MKVMIGKLYKKENVWFVQEPDSRDFFGRATGNSYPLHPDYEKYYFLNEEDNEQKVVFEIVDHNEKKYANLIRDVELSLLKRVEELEAKQIETDRRIDIMIKWINDNVPKKPMMFQTDGPIMTGPNTKWSYELNIKE